MKTILSILIFCLSSVVGLGQLGLEWEVQMRDTRPIDMCLDAQGNAYVMANHDGDSSRALRIFKVGPSGEVLWQHEYVNERNPWFEYYRGKIQQDADGRILFVNNNFGRFLVGKLTKSGNLLWQKDSLDLEPIGFFFDVSVSKNNEIYIVQSNDGIVSNRSELAKLDANGNVLWRRSLASEMENSKLFLLSPLSNGNIVVSGTVNLFPYNSSLVGGKPAILAYDPQGTLLWSHYQDLDSTMSYDCTRVIVDEQSESMYCAYQKRQKMTNLIKLDYDGNVIFNNVIQGDSVRSGLVAIKLLPNGDIVVPHTSWNYNRHYSIGYYDDRGALKNRAHLEGFYLKYGVAPDALGNLYFIADSTSQFDSPFHVFQLNSSGRLVGSFEFAKADTIDHQMRLFEVSPSGDAYVLGSLNGFYVKNAVLFKLSTPLGVSEVTEPNRMKIFPNPTQGMAQLDLSEQFIGGKLVVYNIQGQMMYNRIIKSRNEALNLSHVPLGVYVVDCTDVDGEHQRTRVGKN